MKTAEIRVFLRTSLFKCDILTIWKHLKIFFLNHCDVFFLQNIIIEEKINSKMTTLYHKVEMNVKF
jgi:hypothetical protein